MLLLLFLLLLLSIPEEIFGIICVYSDESFEWKLNDSNYEEFENEVNTFPSYDYEDDNINMCRVEIFIDYKSNLLIISFGDSFQWSQLYREEGHLDFLIILDQTNNTEAEYYNVLEYACYDQNLCNKKFLFNQINWLKQMKYTEFQRQLKLILFNNSIQTEYCFTDKSTLLECQNGVCSGKYHDYYKTYLFECLENSFPSTEVHITTSMIISEEKSTNEINIQENKIIRYTCQFNQCNNQLLTDSIINVVQNYFPLTPMRNAFNLSYQKDQPQQISFSPTNSSSQIPFETTTTQQTTSEMTSQQIPSEITSQQISSSKSDITESLISNIANKSFHISINLIFILIFDQLFF